MGGGEELDGSWLPAEGIRGGQSPLINSAISRWDYRVLNEF